MGVVPVAVSFTNGAPVVTEGTSAGMSVTLDADPARTVVVELTATPGAGTVAGDYSGVPGSLTFTSGHTVRVFTFTAADNALDEADKSVELGFGTLPAWVSAGSQATSVVRLADDEVPVLSVADAGGTEGEVIEFEVTLAPVSRRAVTVTWSTADGTGSAGATAGEDYTAASGMLSFAPGETSATLTVQTLPDALDEDDETFAVRLDTAAGAPVDRGAAAAAATIADDDPASGLGIGDAAVAEAAGTATFEVTLAPASGREVAVDWATADGPATAGATAGADYVAASGTLTFAPGETAKTVEVTVLDDTGWEDGETFTVELGNARNATLADGSGEGAIADDDDGPLLVLAVEPPQIAEHDGAATVTVSIENAARFAGDRTIALGLAGTAAAGDYTVTDAHGDPLAAPGQLTLPAGEASVTATVTPVDDAFYESDETVVVTAFHAGAAIGAGETLVITDETDRAQVVSMTFRRAAHSLPSGYADQWPFELDVVFDREVTGLEGHEVAVTHGRVLSVRHPGPRDRRT